jgi:hypothetical protein
MLSVLRLLLIMRLTAGRGWAWRVSAILSLLVFWLLIYSVVR